MKQNYLHSSPTAMAVSLKEALATVPNVLDACLGDGNKDWANTVRALRLVDKDMLQIVRQTLRFGAVKLKPRVRSPQLDFAHAAVLAAFHNGHSSLTDLAVDLSEPDVLDFLCMYLVAAHRLQPTSGHQAITHQVAPAGPVSTADNAGRATTQPLLKRVNSCNVSLGDGMRLPLSSLLQLCGALPSLTSLAFDGVRPYTNVSQIPLLIPALTVASRLQDLRLDVLGSRADGDLEEEEALGIIHQLSAAPQLQRLSLPTAPLTVFVLQALARYCPRLEQLCGGDLEGGSTGPFGRGEQPCICSGPFLTYVTRLSIRQVNHISVAMLLGALSFFPALTELVCEDSELGLGFAALDGMPQESADNGSSSSNSAQQPLSRGLQLSVEAVKRLLPLVARNPASFRLRGTYVPATAVVLHAVGPGPFPFTKLSCSLCMKDHLPEGALARLAQGQPALSSLDHARQQGHGQAAAGDIPSSIQADASEPLVGPARVLAGTAWEALPQLAQRLPFVEQVRVCMDYEDETLVPVAPFPIQVLLATGTLLKAFLQCFPHLKQMEVVLSSEECDMSVDHLPTHMAIGQLVCDVAAGSALQALELDAVPPGSAVHGACMQLLQERGLGLQLM